VGKGIQQTRQANGNERQIAQFHLLWDQVVLLAIKHGRAPLPVSPAVWKALQRQGVLNDLYDLGSIARRLSFLGDGRLLLDELKLRTTTRSPVQETVSKEIEIATEGHP
jgi:hypothetical protein